MQEQQTIINSQGQKIRQLQEIIDAENKRIDQQKELIIREKQGLLNVKTEVAELKKLVKKFQLNNRPQK